MPNVGDVIYASDRLAARLTSDFTLATSSTSLQNVTGLSVSVPANSVYAVEIMLGVVNAAGTTEDVQFGASFPAGASLIIGAVGSTVGGLTGNAATDMHLPYNAWASGSATGFAFGASTTNSTAIMRGTLTVSSTAGTLQIMAAQNTSGVNATTIVNGSHMLLTRIA